MTHDVVVIGGGPSGSTAATILAREGLDVLVLERERFPRDHVGESLLPYCYPIFEELGVLDQMAERFVRKPGVRFIDPDGRTQTTWCFDHVLKGPEALSFHVIRGEFDRLLLENAERTGAHVLQGTKATAVDLDASGAGVVVRTDGGGGHAEHRARFLVDASGRDTFLAARNRTKEPHEAFDRAALSTHWSGAADPSGGLDEGLLQIVYLGGSKRGWIWIIPVGPDRASVGVVLDHAYVRSRKAELLASHSGDWMADLYRGELASSPWANGILANGSTLMPLMFNGDYSYTVRSKYGPTFASVGDAGAFIDPIFASGVYLSMNASRLVAHALVEGLRGDAPIPTLLAPVYERIDGAYALVDEAIRLFYEPVGISFAQIGSIEELIHRRHENAMAVGHFLLAGDFFEQHDRYRRFLRLLRDPELLEAYRTYTITRPAFRTTTCRDARAAPAVTAATGTGSVSKGAIR